MKMLNFLPLALSLLTFSYPASSAINASIPPSTIEFPPPPAHPPPSHPFLEDVLKAISTKKGWNLEEIRVSGIRSARVAASQRYEFRLRIGKTVVVFRFSDEISSWRKLGKWGGFGLGLGARFGLKPVITGLELKGPVELRVAGDDNLSLLLPLNTTHTGLKRILVNEGIAVEVKGAQEVTLIHPFNDALPVNRSLVIHEARKQSMPFGDSTCTSLCQIHISGSASLIAYRSRSPIAHIQTAFLSPNTVELLPDRCYTGYYGKNLACPIYSLTSRIALVEKLLRNFLGDRIFQNRSNRLLRARITASTIIRFQLELERDLGNNNTTWDRMAAWRTKPKLERVWFEVVARVEAERLKPLMVKKVTPFVALDTTAWSNLMSNVSFTQIPSGVVPPESLTLDVKW